MGTLTREQGLSLLVALIIVMSIGLVAADGDYYDGDGDYDEGDDDDAGNDTHAYNNTTAGGHTYPPNTSIADIPSLVAYWAFDRTGALRDWSGNGNNATIVDYVEKDIDGVFNSSAYRFDGQDDYAVVQSTPGLEPTDEVTLSLWVNVANRSHEYQAFLSKDYGMQWYIGTSHPDYTPHTFRWHLILQGGEFPFKNQYEFEYGEWYHLAMTYDATTRNWSRYVNGELIGWDRASCNGDGCKLSSTEKELCIGYSCHYDRNFLHGMLDDIQIYNESLSGEMVRRIYRGELRYDHHHTAPRDRDGEDDEIEESPYDSSNETGEDAEENETTEIPGDNRYGTENETVGENHTTDDGRMEQPEREDNESGEQDAGPRMSDVTVLSESVRVRLVPGSKRRTYVSVLNNGTADAEVTVDAAAHEELISFERSSYRVEADRSIRIPVKIDTAVDTQSGTYRTVIRVLSNHVSRSIPVVITVAGGNTGNVGLSFDVETQEQNEEDMSIRADVEIASQSGDETQYTLTTTVVNQRGEVIAEKRQNVSVAGSERVPVTFDDSIPKGNYSIEVSATSRNGSASSASSFSVRDPVSQMTATGEGDGPDMREIILLALVALFAIGGVTVYKWNALYFMMAPDETSVSEQKERVEQKLDKLFERKKKIEQQHEAGEMGEEEYSNFVEYFEDKEDHLMEELERLEDAGEGGE